MSGRVKRWEIDLLDGKIHEFEELYAMFHADTVRHWGSYNSGHWIICYPCEEFKILATLRFRLQVRDAFGTSVI